MDAVIFEKITAYKWALSLNLSFLDLGFDTEKKLLEKKNSRSRRSKRKKNPGVPSYTPPQKRGGERDSLVAFGCKK